MMAFLRGRFGELVKIPTAIQLLIVLAHLDTAR